MLFFMQIEKLIKNTQNFIDNSSLESFIELKFSLNHAEVFKVFNSDFKVQELTTFLPENEGAHLLLEVEKQGLSHFEMVQYLSKQLGIRDLDIGTAGQKDADAWTRQRVSVPLSVEGRLELCVPHEQIIFRKQGYIQNKIRTGQLDGNRFEITLRQLPYICDESWKRALELRAEAGFKNFYGSQRFGRDWSQQMRRLNRSLSGEKVRIKRQKFAISQFQSAFFNLYSQEKCGTFDTGPMYGWKSKAKDPTQFDSEISFAKEYDFMPETMKAFGKSARGARRRLISSVTGLELLCNEKTDGDKSTVTLAFALESGSYATVFLRQLLEDVYGSMDSYESGI